MWGSCIHLELRRNTTKHEVSYQDTLVRSDLPTASLAPFDSTMKPYNTRQPDKGGIKGSAKATISLPIAQPLADDELTNKPSETSGANMSNPHTGGEGHKGSVRRTTPLFLISISTKLSRHNLKHNHFYYRPLCRRARCPRSRRLRSTLRFTLPFLRSRRPTLGRSTPHNSCAYRHMAIHTHPTQAIPTLASGPL
jgi:hypothetical protein